MLNLNIYVVLKTSPDPPNRIPFPLPKQPQSKFSVAGLLGSVTQTANVAACPGKCIHALASLMCDTVLEEVPQKPFLFETTFDLMWLQVQCPSSNMRCCVEKSGGSSPPNRDTSIPGLSLSMPPRWILFSQKL